MFTLILSINFDEKQCGVFLRNFTNHKMKDLKKMNCQCRGSNTAKNLTRTPEKGRLTGYSKVGAEESVTFLRYRRVQPLPFR